MINHLQYPALYKLIKEYERIGYHNDWGQFKKETEKALIDDWISVEDEMPAYNLGVLVYVENEDHITSGMWDISKKWVLLDEYRHIEGQHIKWWKRLPGRPVKIK